MFKEYANMNFSDTRDLSTSFGLVVKVSSNNIPKDKYDVQNLDIQFSNSWNTVGKFSDNHIYIIVIGHLYARESDTFDLEKSLSILCNRYQKNGITSVFEAIGGGMFAFILIDAKLHKLFAFCDLLACMPLFFLSESHSITLATNQLDLQSSCNLSKESCFEYIQYGYLSYTPSLFEGVQRLGPEQILTIDLSSTKILNLTEEKYPEYPAVADRINDLDVACQRLDIALNKFYNRIDNDSISLGLSGGYDSRLIAAFTKRFTPHLVTFNYPGTAETQIAGIIAQLLGTSTNLVEIPAEAPATNIADFIFGMQTLDNLESSHVFALLNALMKVQPCYVIDGYLGDTILGGYYYYKLAGGVENLLKVLSLQDTYGSGIRSIDEYIAICRSGFGRTIDLRREFIFEGNNIIKSEILESLVLKQVKNCHTHADMLELLKYRFRGRCMIACGPIAFLRRVTTLCPYYDTEVLNLCLSIKKQLRAGERFYNAYWRYRYPEIAHVPKESTGGNALQTDLVYRLTHFKNALFRKIKNKLPMINRKNNMAGGNTADFLGKYFSCSQNRIIFDAEIDSARSIMESAGLGSLLTAINKPGVSKQLYFRVASLAILLSQKSKKFI